MAIRPGLADILHNLRQVNLVADAILNLGVLIISVHSLVLLLPAKPRERGVGFW